MNVSSASLPPCLPACLAAFAPSASAPPSARRTAAEAPPPPLVAMETRRWQHPAVCAAAASILVPLCARRCRRVDASVFPRACVSYCDRRVRHGKMAMARLVACLLLYSSLGKLSLPLFPPPRRFSLHSTPATPFRPRPHSERRGDSWVSSSGEPDRCWKPWLLAELSLR